MTGRRTSTPTTDGSSPGSGHSSTSTRWPPGLAALTGLQARRLEEQELAQAVLDALFGMGRLQVLVDDDANREHRHQRVRSGLGDLRRRLQAVHGARSRLRR